MKSRPAISAPSWIFSLELLFLHLTAFEEIDITMMDDHEKSGALQPNAQQEAIDNMDPIEPVQTNNARPACFRSTIQEILFVLTATMAIAMGSLLTGSITVISNFVGRDLKMTTAEITWITSSSTLSSGAFLLFFGRVADLFGAFLIHLQLYGNC